MMSEGRWIVRHAKKHCRYIIEIYTEQKIAWDRYDELKGDDKCHRLSFIAPADDETYKQILNGEWDY